MSNQFLIVGLGNPGKEYHDTRHNVGFRCVDALAAAYGLSYDSKKKSKAKVATGMIADSAVVLVKPQTYMNLSGSSVQGLAAFYKVPPAQIIVVYDDLDLPPGTLRIRAKGGSGGHRGMTDIIQRLGTQDFPRIRFGIGRPPDRMDPAAFVLRRFDAEESPVVDEAVTRVLKTIEMWLSDSINNAMNHYNGTAEEVAARFAKQAEQESETKLAAPSDDSTTPKNAH
jgi:peptidyl-tRNA hydrolase, PTH1 family